MQTRRDVLQSLVALAATFSSAGALAGPRRRQKRRVRRRVRRRTRRRIRRHVVWRTVGGRRALVVPLAVAVGWELALGPDVVVVHEVKKVQVEGATREVIVVVHKDGKKEEVEIVREDTEENKKELDGSEVAAGDTTTPARELEVEVEEEVEVED